jgi:hypothetical protein
MVLSLAFIYIVTVLSLSLSFEPGQLTALIIQLTKDSSANYVYIYDRRTYADDLNE